MNKNSLFSSANNVQLVFKGTWSPVGGSLPNTTTYPNGSVLKATDSNTISSVYYKINSFIVNQAGTWVPFASYNYNDIYNLPTLGTASTLNATTAGSLFITLDTTNVTQKDTALGNLGLSTYGIGLVKAVDVTAAQTYLGIPTLLNNKEDKSNKVQNLSSPLSTTYISTQGLTNFFLTPTFGDVTATTLNVTGATTLASFSTSDKIITIGGNIVPTSDDAKDKGVEFRWHNGTSAKLGYFGFDRSTGFFTFIPDATNTADVISGTKGIIDANLNGSAISLATSRSISITGDISYTVNFDGTANVTAAATLANVVTAGSSAKPIYNTKGLITGSGTLLASDIPNLDWTKITTGLPTTLAGYGIVDAQVTLVSATNIKTINGQSILGSGDLPVGGGGAFLPLAGGTLTGNLDFSGTGLRITGDFSNATVASRVLFQTNIANSPTRIDAIPSGTATTATLGAFNNSDPTNASWLRLAATISDVRLESLVTGTGTLLPIIFNIGASTATTIDTSLTLKQSGTISSDTASPYFDLSITGTSAGGLYTSSTAVIALARSGKDFIIQAGGTADRLQIKANGNVNIVTVGAKFTGDFSNATPSLRNSFQTNTLNSNSNVCVVPNGTATQSAYTVFNNSSPDNSSRGSFIATGSDIQIRSDKEGTGIYLPINIILGGSTRATFDINGNFSLTENLTFTGSAKRIFGDFNNATLANRLMFQNSVANSTTSVGVIPSGTGVAANSTYFNNSDPTNSAYAQISANSTAIDIVSGIRGTGTYLPMNFSVAGTQVAAFDTSGNYSLSGNLTFTGLGKRFQADFSNATLTNRFYFQTSTLNSTTSVGIAPNGTSQNANLLALNSSDLANASYIGLAGGPTSVNINSGARGTGTLLPINFNMGGIDAIIIDTSANTNITGNLNLTGVGKRITSDFSNTTITSRTLFQSSTVNGATRIDVIPNGSGTTANIGAFNNSNPTNASWARLTATSTDIRVESTISGTGTYLPLNFYTSGNLQLSIALNGVATFTNSIVTSGSMNAASYLGAGVSTSAVANTLVKRDGNSDVYANNFTGNGNVQVAGTVQGSALNLIGSGPVINWQDNNSPATSMTQYISFKDNTNAEVGWIGYGAGNGEIGLSNQGRNIKFYSPVVAQSNVDIGGYLTATNTVSFYSATATVLNLNQGAGNGLVNMQLGGVTKGYINWDSTGVHILDASASSKIDVSTSGVNLNGYSTMYNGTAGDVLSLNTGGASGTMPFKKSGVVKGYLAWDNTAFYLLDANGNNRIVITNGQVLINGLTGSGTSLSGVILKDTPTQTLQNIGSIGSTCNINVASGSHVLATATANCTFTFTNSLSSTEAMTMVLELTNGGSFTMSFPAGTRWDQGVQPALTTGTDILVFSKAGSANWRGYLASKNNS